MKKFYFIALLLISQHVFSQHASTGFGRWKIGVNIGGSFQTADVSTKLFGLGYGATLEYTMIENNHSFFGFSFRGRYLRAKTYGNHYKLNSEPISNNNINGVLDSNFNYSNIPLYQNNKTTLNEYSLEAMLKWNSLYQKTGVLFYVYAGGGLTHYRVRTNQLDNSGNLYDYSSIDNTADKSSIQDALNNLRNDDYETTLSSPAYKSVVFTPTTGIGIGYRIAPFFDIAFEHKMSLPRTQLFDGQIHETNDPTFVQDIYHYTSVNFIFHIVHRSYGTSYTPYEDTYIAPVATGTSTTQSSPTTTTNPSSTATTTTPSGTGNTVTTGTVIGSGTGVVTTTVYQPNITLTAPAGTNFTTPNCAIKIEANITYINSQNDISFYQNGNKIANYQFFYNQGKFTATVNLSRGNNHFKIIAVNGNLSDTKEFDLSCNNLNQIAICHNNPTTNRKENIVIYEKDWATHSSHGDIKGTCPVITPVGTEVGIGTTINTNDPLISICHHPSGNGVLENIKIKTSEWALHASHGDSKGFCPVTNTTTVPPKGTGVAITDPSINICHNFKGEKSNLTIKQSEWALHKAHGDSKGFCPITNTTTTPPKGTGVVTPDPLINICHTFKGEKSNLTIKQSEWAFHKAHGDSKGNCPPKTQTGVVVAPVLDINQTMITICHNISGQPGKVETISIPENKWLMHKSHGDTKGSCRQITSPPKGTGTITNDPLISICHHPVGNAPFQNIQIKTSEWNMHKAHGDSKGKCPPQHGNSSGGNNSNMISICHNVSGMPGKTQNIIINSADWQKHKSHGDIRGNCPQGNSTPIDPSTGTSVGGGNNAQKITICHIPPGNNATPQTIQISPGSWLAHKAHGDSKGSCSNKVVKPRSTTPRNTTPKSSNKPKTTKTKAKPKTNKPKTIAPKSSKPKKTSTKGNKTEITPPTKTTKKGKN